MKQIVLATTLFGAMTAAAAIDEGKLGQGYTERILLTATNAPVPEVVDPLTAAPGADAVLARFSRTLSLNEVIDPQHPSQWRVEGIDGPAVERLLRRYWELGDEPVTLVIESVHVPPAATLAEVFADSPIIVLSEGLMSYGATRDPQEHTFGQRLEKLVYLDLVEGLEPLLLSEHGVAPEAVSPAAFRRLVEEMAALVADSLDRAIPASEKPTALVLGQYLAAIRLISSEEEVAMQVAMLERAVEGGARRILFKAHPSAPAADLAAIADAASQLDVEVVVVRDPVAAEVLLAHVRVELVVACFSTALVTARRVFGLPIASVGVERMLEVLTPYENSNRIPATVIRALTREDGHARSGENLQRLVTAVAYCMQPRTLASGRDVAIQVLSGIPVMERAEYFRRRRLGRLGLPGGLPAGRRRRLATAMLNTIPAGARARAVSAARRVAGRRRSD